MSQVLSQIKQWSCLLLWALQLVSIQGQSIKIPYTFPVKPGMPEWAELSSQEERIEVCNISAERAANLTTPALVATCMGYPLRTDYIFQNGGLAERVSRAMQPFRGYHVLLKRRNAAKHLLDAYMHYPASKALRRKTHLDFLDYEILNGLLLNEIFLRQLNEVQLAKLLHRALENTRVMREKEGVSAEAASSRLACKIIYFTKLSKHIQQKPLDASTMEPGVFRSFVSSEFILAQEHMDAIHDFQFEPQTIQKKVP